VWLTYQVYSFPAPNTVGIGSVQQAVAWAPGWSSWHRLPPPPSGFDTFGATAIWTGTKVLVLNGTSCLPSMSCPNALATHWSSFDPSTDAWRPIPSNLVASAAGPVVWTGRSVVALDAASESPPDLVLGDAVVFDPGADTWSSLPHSPLVLLFGAKAVWTGTQVIIWGAGSSTSNAAGTNPMGEALMAATP